MLEVAYLTRAISGYSRCPSPKITSSILHTPPPQSPGCAGLLELRACWQALTLMLLQQLQVTSWYVSCASCPAAFLSFAERSPQSAPENSKAAKIKSVGTDEYGRS
eukprot:1157899-Pelagomonas_calceolata.AAC.7